ncbi:AsmA family protein [bacterium]|nr:AsmA family protein [bacterium]
MKYLILAKKLFFIILGIFIITEFLFLLSPKIINLNNHKKEVSAFTKKIINTDFTYDNLTFKTYPDFSIRLKAENAKLENLANIKELNMKLGFLKLILGKITLKNLKINNSSINIIVYEDGSTNLDKILLPKPFEVELKNSDCKINNYNLFLEEKKSGQKININGDYISSIIKKNNIDASIKGDIISKNENAKIDLKIQIPLPDIKTKFKNTGKYILLTGYIKNLNIDNFEEFIKTYISNDIKNIDGIINAEFTPDYNNNELKSINTNILLDNFKIISSKKENSLIIKGKNYIKAETIVNKNNLNIESFEFSGDGYKINAKGIIENYKAKNSKADFDIDINNSKVEALYWMLPSNLFTENEEIRKIKKYGAYGIANGNLQIKGTFAKPEIYGKVDFKDVWILDGLPDNVPKAEVKTNFRKDTVDVDVKVWATEKEYVTVVGYSNFFDLADNEYQINSTENVPLAVAQKMLPPISDVLGFMIGPVPIMNIKGLGNIDLNAKGSKENPDLRGYFVFKNASAEFNDIRILKLENANGKIDFKKDKVYFKNDSGTILGKPAEISGVSDIKIDIDYSAKVNDVSMSKLLETLKTSPMLKDYAKQVKILSDIEGNGDILLNLKGHIDNPKMITNPDVIKFIKPKGSVSLKNAKVTLNYPKASLLNTNGEIKIDNNKVEMDLAADLFTSPIKISGKIINNNANLNITSSKIKLIDSAKFLIGFYRNNIKNLNNISTFTTFTLDMNYKGSAENINLNGVNLKASFPSKSTSTFPIDVLSGVLSVKNGNLKAENINSKFYNTTAFVNGKIDNLFKKPVVNMDLSLMKFDLSTINNIKNSSIIPNKFRKILNAYKDYKGTISAKLHIINNNINGNIWLRDIKFSHAILDYPFSVASSDFIFKNGNLDINSFNALFAGTPIFINGKINNIIKNPDYNINFSSKLSKDFVDNYINTNLSYPINVKGEILLSSEIQGTKDNINIKPSMKLEEGADISYMGANIGEENSIREIKGDIQKLKNKLIIKNIDYSKYIYSQNNRLYPLLMVNIKASINDIKNKPFIEDFTVKTHNPISANIFNAIFKKSLVKNGNMQCDLKITGYFNNPKIIGNTQFKNVDIPLYETYIDNVKINFSPKYIDTKAKIDYLNSDMNISAKIRNNDFRKLYFENIEIDSKRTDLNKVLYVLNEISYKNPIQIVGQNMKQNTVSAQPPIDLKNLVIERGSIKTDTILYKNLPVSNFSSKLSFKNNNFKLDNVSIDIAGGKLNGELGYNLEKALISVNTKTKGVDANKITEALLDIKNQIYGNLDGSINITTFGADDIERIKNLNGELTFSVNDGKMPKLGSLEYLLRAGNLIKSGISGLTLNNISGLLLPVQHGDFDTIQGNLKIKKGVINDMKIYSKGKNLSILITGQYELESSKTDLYILGKVSKNINTILGPIGNASLNSFFNLIPGVNLDGIKDTDTIKYINSIPELSLPTDKFRIFRAKVDGDIYSDSFVSTFEWVNK